MAAYWLGLILDQRISALTPTTRCPRLIYCLAHIGRNGHWSNHPTRPGQRCHPPSCQPHDYHYSSCLSCAPDGQPTCLLPLASKAIGFMPPNQKPFRVLEFFTYVPCRAPDSSLLLSCYGGGEQRGSALLGADSAMLPGPDTCTYGYTHRPRVGHTQDHDLLRREGVRRCVRAKIAVFYSSQPDVRGGTHQRA